MAQTRKKRTIKTKRDVQSSGKVFVSGLNWSKLSSVYIGDMNTAGVVRRFAAIPYLSSLYGMGLLGFSTNPNELPTGAYVPADSNDQLEDGKLYFPVFDYSGSFAIESLSTVAKDKFADLTAFNVDENVVLHLTTDGVEIGPNGFLAVSSKNSVDEQSYSNVSKFLNASGNDRTIMLNTGSFNVHALLNGSNAISDWISVDQDFENLKVDSFSFSPRVLNYSEETLDEMAMSGRTIVGHAYRFDTSNPDLFDGNNGNFRLLSIATDIFVDETIDQTPYLVETDTKLGGPISKNYLVQRATRTAFEITDNYDLGNHQSLSSGGLLEIYDCVVKPKRSGWYKFFVNGDDNSLLAIDDKILWCGNYAYLSNSNLFRTALSNSIANSDNGRFSLSSLISSNMCDGNETLFDENTAHPLVFEGSIEQTYADMLFNGNDGINDILNMTFPDITSENAQYAFQIREFVLNGSVVLRIWNLKSSQYVFLLKDHKYILKFLVLDSNKSTNNMFSYGIFDIAHFAISESESLNGHELSLHSSNFSGLGNPFYYDNRDLYVMFDSTYKLLSSFTMNQQPSSNMLSLSVVYGSDLLNPTSYGTSTIPNNVSSMLSNVLLSTDIEDFKNYAWANVYKAWSHIQYRLTDSVPRIPFVLNDNFYTESDMLNIMHNFSNKCYKMPQVDGTILSDDFHFNFMPCQLRGPISWT